MDGIDRPETPRNPLLWFVQIIGEDSSDYIVLVKKKISKSSIYDYHKYQEEIVLSTKKKDAKTN